MLKQCRICLEENENIDDLFSPCDCKGTHQYVHTKCLEIWRNQNKDNENYERCQECRADYKTILINNKCFCLKWHIRILYKLIKNTFFSIIFNGIIMFSYGFFIKLILNTLNVLNIFNSDFKYFKVGDIIYDNIILGNMACTIIGLIFYTCISLLNYCKMNTKNKWESSNHMSINKLRKFYFLIFISSIIVPFLSVFLSLFFMQSNWIFFIEYFFDTYLYDKTKILDIPKDEIDTNLLV